MTEARASGNGAGADSGWGAGAQASVERKERGDVVIKPWVDAIAAYKAGESSTPGHDRVIKLSSNENPMGPSPRATDAYRRAVDNLSVYPDSSASGLRAALGDAHGLDPDRLICGAGSDELLSLICLALCGPGDEVVHTEFGFAMYAIAAQAAGAKPVAVPEKDLTADPEAILKAVTPRTKVVFLANPNNPTGTYLGREALTRLADSLPRGVLLVIDGAYAEYMRSADYASGFALAERMENVAVTRTFSKIYGLAALRVGWMYASPTIIGALNKIRGPFNVSGPALAAAEASVRDRDFIEASAIQNEVWRDWLTKELRKLGVETPDSFGNFVLPNFGQTGPSSAAAVDGVLRAQGVIVRRMESYGLPGRLRITIGSPSDNQLVAGALREFLSEAGREGAERRS